LSHISTVYISDECHEVRRKFLPEVKESVKLKQQGGSNRDASLSIRSQQPQFFGMSSNDTSRQISNGRLQVVTGSLTPPCTPSYVSGFVDSVRRDWAHYEYQGSICTKSFPNSTPSSVSRFVDSVCRDWALNMFQFAIRISLPTPSSSPCPLVRLRNVKIETKKVQHKFGNE
jgi:hypothetical protein